MNCDQLAKMNSDVTAKDVEIAELREHLAALGGTPPQEHPVEPPRTEPEPARARKRQAPQHV